MKTYPFFILAFICCSCKYNSEITLPNANNDSILSFFRNEVNPLFRTDHIEKAGKILDSLQPIVNRRNSYKITCAWLRLKSVQKENQDQMDSARYFAEEALRLAKEKDSTQKDILGANIQLASVLEKDKRYMKALEYGNTAYYLAKKIDTLALPLICGRLSRIYASLNDDQMNRKLLFEGYNRSIKAIHKIEFANNISRYYDQIGAYDSAVIFFKTVEKDTSIKSAYFDAIKYENLGINLTRLKRFKEGLQYQLKAAAINKQLGQMDGQSFFNLAATYRELRQLKNALSSLDSAMNLAQEDNDLTLLRRISYARAAILVLQNRHSAAFSAMDSAYTYFSIETDSSLTKQARELDTKYAVRDKDNQIHLLAITNETNLKIRNQQKFIIITIVVGVFLATIVAVLLWRRKQTQMLLREINLKQQLLRVQINPHFIYNAFGIFKSLVRTGLIEKAMGYLDSFAKLMRFNFENAQENLVHLKSEIETLENYLNLQTMYCPGLFDYEIKVYEGFDDDEIFIPPMLLQPFLENAILHGFSKIDYKGKIVITVEKRSYSLLFLIDDNGSGFHPGHKDNKTRSTKINQERLHILQKQIGRPTTLQIVDKKINDQTGTRVEIEVPFRHTRTGKGTSKKSRNYFNWFGKSKMNYN